MELVLFIVLVVLLVLPTFFAMRKQRQRQKEVATFQAALTPGKRVVTAGGIHGTVTAVREGDIDLEVARGMVITVDKMGILRAANTAPNPVGDAPAEPQQTDVHPEDKPVNPDEKN
ncbi:preprotein translocase subunit YajC [Corynebacterium sp. HMSC04H06]|uniref:preprotein translocase subunit YajC n=1 Tax=Corynebacterium sp. HMSC04H06 TaxID=1581050 RepID=UPI0008A1E06A|nr:preprotein translocase subunit YajC [Corynebacterium sp. HMSC04H06]